MTILNDSSVYLLFCHPRPAETGSPPLVFSIFGRLILKNRADCSGRAIGGVHDDAYGDEFEIGSEGAKKATGIANATEA